MAYISISNKMHKKLGHPHTLKAVFFKALMRDFALSEKKEVQESSDLLKKFNSALSLLILGLVCHHIGTD